LGDLFVFIFFGVIGTMGTFYLHTHEISFLAFLTSIPVGALITNILIVNNYRDIEEDREANKITLAVLLGKSFTRWQYIFLLIVCYFISIVLYMKFNYSLWIFLPYLTIPVTFVLIKMLYKFKGEELNKTLELTARLAALYGLLFSIGLIV
jgi:1,4-dihydroxy-2-naphthoate octaprenyltransferase